MNSFFKIVLLSLLLGVFKPTIVRSQERQQWNLQNFDARKYHWGFILAVTNSSFLIKREAQFDFSDSLFSIDPQPVTAFAVGPIASLNFSGNIHLRTAIILSFQDRIINYTFYKDDTTEVFDKKVNSVYTEFPLILKLRTNRINNFALYATGGAKYGYDWASQIGVKESFDFDDIVKIKRSNFAWTVGGGVDFFLPYFKFGIDLKYDFGFNDVNVKNGTFFSNPIQRMETQSWRIAFTFEG